MARHSLVLLGLLVLVAAAPARAIANSTGPTKAAGPASIAALVSSTADFSTLNTLLKLSGLASAVGPDFNGTVFAPTNEAFQTVLDKLGAQANSLATNKELVAALLTYHVTAAKIPSSAIKNGAVVTTLLPNETFTVELAGKNVTLVPTAGPPFGTPANVVKAGVMAGKAIVHVIDGVLIPKSLVDAIANATSPSMSPGMGPSPAASPMPAMSPEASSPAMSPEASSPAMSPESGSPSPDAMAPAPATSGATSVMLLAAVGALLATML